MNHRSTGLLFCLALAGTAWANPDSDGDPSPEGDDVHYGYLTFYLDNDLFANKDRDYTNGVRASWISEDEPALNFLPARRQLEKLTGADGDFSLIRRISGFEEGAVESGEVVMNYGLSLTQLMFTPEDETYPGQPPGQRRYAGWLGVGFSVHAKNAWVLNSTELILGTTGPRSLAQDSQDLIHTIRDINTFQGWDAQVPNEFTLDLSFLQKRRARFLERPESKLSVDGFMEWGARLGSFRTLARTGGFFRIGLNLPPDFSDPRLNSTAYSHRYFRGRDARDADWSLYGLVGANAAAVLFDATLDGPLFKNFDTGNTRETWVGETYLGFGVRWKRLEFSYVHTWRSEEYEEQAGGANFGSLALRFRL